MKATSPTLSAAAQPSARILIVEDDEMDAVLLQETLKKAATADLEMVLAGTLTEALRLLDERRFDIILADLNLPDSTGLDTFRRIYTQAPAIPIILLTGYESEAFGLEAVRAGAQEYIVKGTMNGQALWRVISYAIERQSLEKAVRDSEKRYKRLLDSVTDYIYTGEGGTRASGGDDPRAGFGEGDRLHDGGPGE